jgi:hypothetical protein
VTFVVFARALNAEFLYWDDDWLIFENSKFITLPKNWTGQ